MGLKAVIPEDAQERYSNFESLLEGAETLANDTKSSMFDIHQIFESRDFLASSFNFDDQMEELEDDLQKVYDKTCELWQAMKDAAIPIEDGSL